MIKPYDILKALIWEDCQYAKANGGSVGIDHESLEKFESHLSSNLYKLWNRMCSGSDFPPPVKGVAIPKKSGGVRIQLQRDKANMTQFCFGWAPI